MVRKNKRKGTSSLLVGDCVGKKSGVLVLVSSDSATPERAPSLSQFPSSHFPLKSLNPQFFSILYNQAL